MPKSSLDPARPRILRPSVANLTRVAALLRRGKIAGVPSETVYGLAANALSSDACAKIFAAKGRPTTDPLIVHLSSARDLARVAVPNALALRLAAECWPGPLTLILPKQPAVPDLVTASKSTVAVRVPAHPLFRRLIRLAGVPLAAPSANPFGYISPTTAQHVRDGFPRSAVPAILDGGECSIGVESTIVDLSSSTQPRLLRPGGLAIEAIEAVLGIRVLRPKPAKLPVNVAAPAPGMLTKHYSPRTPVVLHARISAASCKKIDPRAAVLLLRRPAGAATADKRVHWLSETGELGAVARNLFGALRRLDAADFTAIHVESPPGPDGLAPAIRDRLVRAAAKA